MTDILFLSAAELAEHYRQRALSPVEVLDATLARAEAIQPALTAPLVASLPALEVFMLCGVAAAVAVLFLLPLRLPG